MRFCVIAVVEQQTHHNVEPPAKRALSDEASDVPSEDSDVEEKRPKKSSKPLPPSVQRKLNRQKLEARLSVKRNSAMSVTISAKPKEDMVRSLARKGLEATFKLILEDVRERPSVYKVVDKSTALDEPKTIADRVEKELFENLAVAKGDGSRPECGDAVCFRPLRPRCALY